MLGVWIIPIDLIPIVANGVKTGDGINDIDAHAPLPILHT
jgi:hypothetical protein